MDCEYKKRVQTLQARSRTVLRSNNYRICQWDVLDVAETAALAAKKAAAVIAPNPAVVKVSDIPLPRPARLFYLIGRVTAVFSYARQTDTLFSVSSLRY
jgi:hypothetical protein